MTVRRTAYILGCFAGATRGEPWCARDSERLSFRKGPKKLNHRIVECRWLPATLRAPIPDLRMRKDSDYLQFRPYHAFTSHAAPPAKTAGGLWWWLLIAGAAALLLVAVGLWLGFR